MLQPGGEFRFSPNTFLTGTTIQQSHFPLRLRKFDWKPGSNGKGPARLWIHVFTVPIKAGSWTSIQCVFYRFIPDDHECPVDDLSDPE
jgi:hypothetical protein